VHQIGRREGLGRDATELAYLQRGLERGRKVQTTADHRYERCLGQSLEALRSGKLLLSDARNEGRQPIEPAGRSRERACRGVIHEASCASACSEARYVFVAATDCSFPGGPVPLPNPA
jgi:hypothetical protein